MLVLVLYPNWILQSEARTSRGCWYLFYIQTGYSSQRPGCPECWYLFYIQTGYSSQRPGRPEDVGTCSISKLDTPVRGQDVLNVGTCSISKLDTPVRGQDVQRMLVLVLYPNWILQSEARTSRECWYLFYIQTGYSSQRPTRP